MNLPKTELTNDKIDISKYHLWYCQSKHRPDKALSEPYPCDCGLEELIHQAEIKAVNEALQSIENEATSEIGYGGDRRFMEMGMILFKRLHDPEALEKEIVA